MRDRALKLMLAALVGSLQPSALEARSVPPTVSSPDQEVLDAVLADLLTYKGKDSPLALRSSKQFGFAPDSADWPVTPEQLLRQSEPGKWQLSASDTSRLREAVEDLVSRVARKAGFAGFRSRVPGVRTYTPPAGEAGPTATWFEDRPVVAWPPGYSMDGSLAVVRLSVPWSMHSADATYVVARRAEGWTILVRELCIYV